MTMLLKLYDFAGVVTGMPDTTALASSSGLRFSVLDLLRLRRAWLASLAAGGLGHVGPFDLLTWLAAKTDLLGHIAANLRVAFRHHRVIRLETEAFAVLRRGQTMSRQVTLQRLVWLAIDHRDDVIFGSQRFARGYGGSEL